VVWKTLPADFVFDPVENIQQPLLAAAKRSVNEPNKSINVLNRNVNVLKC